MVKWNEITWYSKLGAIILLLGVVPALCFYIGMQYELTQQTLSIVSVQSVSEKPITTDMPDLSRIAGYYTAGSRVSINISPLSSNTIKVTGSASYQGQYSTYFGSMSAIGTVYDNVAHVTLGTSCDLYLIFAQYDFGTYIDARETDAGGPCGFGNNVSFQDSYTRASTTTQPITGAKGEVIQ